jgi:6-hydroxy-3-succinoylpyridine 3-monooxygenase
MDSPIADIWKLEEKMSDVALAMHAFRDAVRGHVDHVVIVTNDTDLEPCLRLIKEETKAVLGLIVPAKSNDRNPNKALVKHADWVRGRISESELRDAQLPNMVMWEGKPQHKPVSWYPRPDLLQPLLNEAIRVRGSKGSALKWMSAPCAHLQGRIPLEMASSDLEAEELRNYMEKYATDFHL